MEEKNSLFGRKHATLWRISMWANGCAPIVLFLYGFLSFWQIVTYGVLAHNQYKTDLINLLLSGPFFTIDLFLKMTAMFIKGAVYFLTLKGIALGLDMLVETDVNFREKKIEEGKE